MQAQTIDSIYTHFRASFKETPEFVIDYYRQNAGVMDGIQHFSSPSELKYFSELSWHYLNALFSKDHYNETIDEAEKRLLIIERHLKLLNDRSVKDEWYFGIYLLKGMAAFKLRNFRVATKLFKHLADQDPQNDLYRKWLRDSLYSQRLRIIHAIWAVAALLLLFVLFFEEFIPSSFARLGLTVAGFLGVAFNLGYEFYAKRSFRKKPSSPAVLLSNSGYRPSQTKH